MKKKMGRQPGDIWHEDIVELGFTMECVGDDQYTGKYGIPYKEYNFDLTKRIYIDWDPITLQCKVNRMNKEGDILNYHIISSFEELRTIIEFFTQQRSYFEDNYESTPF